jgi:hypothetical protein
MFISRRMALTGPVSFVLTRATFAQPGIDWSALAKEDTEAPSIPSTLADFADQPSVNGPITSYEPFGTHPPKPEEEVLA